MDDIRVDAVLLAAVGGVLGYFLPFFYITAITAGAVACGALMLWAELRCPSVRRSSAAVGLVMIVGGSIVCFFVPMWLVHWLK
jgi:hypothetical protein